MEEIFTAQFLMIYCFPQVLKKSLTAKIFSENIFSSKAVFLSDIGAYAIRPYKNPCTLLPLITQGFPLS